MVQSAAGKFLIERAGNILMISEGRSGLDNVFTLKEGARTILLSKYSG